MTCFQRLTDVRSRVEMCSFLSPMEGRLGLNWTLAGIHTSYILPFSPLQSFKPAHSVRSCETTAISSLCGPHMRPAARYHGRQIPFLWHEIHKSDETVDLCCCSNNTSFSLADKLIFYASLRCSPISQMRKEIPQRVRVYLQQLQRQASSLSLTSDCTRNGIRVT